MGYYDSHNLFPYDTEVLETKLEDQLLTKLNMYQFATADNSLTENVGNVKKIRTYIGTGYAEDVEMGEGNTQDIGAGYVESDYRVKYTQDRFPYFDEQLNADDKAIEAGLKRASVALTNDMTSKVVREFNNATMKVENFGWEFDDVVDAVAMFPDETVSGLFLLINKQEEAKIKKNCKDYLSYVEAYVRTGYVGTLDGIPIYVSDAVPKGVAFLANKEAVTIFWKKNLGVEQERDPNTRKTTVYSRFCNVVALTDADKVIKLMDASQTFPVAKDAEHVKVAMLEKGVYNVFGKNAVQGFTDDEFGTVTGPYSLITLPDACKVGTYTIKQINPALAYFYPGDPSITIVDGQYVKEKSYTFSAVDDFKFMVTDGKTSGKIIIDDKEIKFNGDMKFAANA